MSDEAQMKDVLEALKSLTVMVADNTAKTLEIQEMSKKGHEHIENVVKAELAKRLPFDHNDQHDLLRIYLTHSPEPRVHSEDHTYIKNSRDRMGKLISSIISALGPIILAAFLLGAWTYFHTEKPDTPAPTISSPTRGGN